MPIYFNGNYKTRLALMSQPSIRLYGILIPDWDSKHMQAMINLSDPKETDTNTNNLVESLQ